VSALDREFSEFKEKSSSNFHWYKLLWQDEVVESNDWALLDAWYRSRSLGLPKSGEAMVPCLDFANHSDAANAYYEETADEDVVLLLRPGATLEDGDEITISYGGDKSAAEMLFSYGFVGDGSNQTGGHATALSMAADGTDSPTAANPSSGSLMLPLSPLENDPLAGAKRFVMGRPPTVRVSQTAGQVTWDSPGALLMCLNEEDGLNFGYLRDNDGNEQLRMFWQDRDVTESAHDAETLVGGHPLEPVFRLRVATVVQETLSSALERMQAAEMPRAEASPAVRGEVLEAAGRLREVECGILTEAVRKLELEVSIPPFLFFVVAASVIAGCVCTYPTTCLPQPTKVPTRRPRRKLDRQSEAQCSGEAVRGSRLFCANKWSVRAEGATIHGPGRRGLPWARGRCRFGSSWRGIRRCGD
jgi:hypothetical protein